MASSHQKQLFPAEHAQPASDSQAADGESAIIARLSATNAAFGNVLTSGGADNAFRTARSAQRRLRQGFLDFSAKPQSSDDESVETPDAPPAQLQSVDQPPRLAPSNGQASGASDGTRNF